MQCFKLKIDIDWCSSIKVSARKIARNIEGILFVLNTVLTFEVDSFTRHNTIIALELKPFKPIIYSLIIWRSCLVFKLINNMI